MPLVDKLLTATIRYLQKKQISLRKKSKRKKAAGKKKKKRSQKKTRLRLSRAPKRPVISTGKKTNTKPPQEKALGVVTHYFSRIEVVVIKLSKAGLKVGDTIRIKGSATDFTQKVKSLQIESVDVTSARKGALVGLKAAHKAREGDAVYLVC